MRLIILPLTAILAGSAIAGCGGSSSPPSNTSSSPPPFKTFVAAADRNAACMRDHGVTNFPDPQVTDHNGEQAVAIHVVGNSPQFRAAMSACNRLAPLPGKPGVNQGTGAAQQATHKRALLEFAQCMRTHGFPNFPDPDNQGRLSLTTVTAAGIQIHQPAVLKEGEACAGATHGVLTPADVVRAVNRGSS